MLVAVFIRETAERPTTLKHTYTHINSDVRVYSKYFTAGYWAVAIQSWLKIIDAISVFSKLIALKALRRTPFPRQD